MSIEALKEKRGEQGLQNRSLSQYFLRQTYGLNHHCIIYLLTLVLNKNCIKRVKHVVYEMFSFLNLIKNISFCSVGMKTFYS